MAAEPKIELFNADWRDILPRYESNWFDLAIVDPPYGIGISNNSFRQKHEKKDWDNDIPTPIYFEELKRVSKNQIIWGANYFTTEPSQGFIIWDKKQPENFSSAMCEYAWSSIQSPAKIFRKHVVTAEPNKIHPTQKPVALYRWLLQNYAKEGDKILDTHLGSGSIAIACYEEKFDLVACEIDEDYFAAMKKRYDEYRKQLQLFS